MNNISEKIFKLLRIRNDKLGKCDHYPRHVCLSVHLHVKLKEYLLNNILGNFTKMYQYIYYFVKI
jgi:hypothetical protein